MASVHRFIKDVFPGRDNYVISGGASVSAGDMMQWDTGANIATNALLASGAIFLGISEETSPLASLGTTSAPLTGNIVRIVSQGVFQMKTTSGETYSHTQPVFQGADAQTITLVSNGRMVGSIHLPLGGTVSGGSGTLVDVRVLGYMTNCGVLPNAAVK